MKISKYLPLKFLSLFVEESKNNRNSYLRLINQNGLTCLAIIFMFPRVSNKFKKYALSYAYIISIIYSPELFKFISVL